jgi:F-type H+-transporting ATPase subunit alpha
MAVTLLAANKGFFDDVPTAKVLAFEADLHGHMKSKYKKLMNAVEKNKALSADDEKAVVDAIKDFKSSSAY